MQLLVRAIVGVGLGVALVRSAYMTSFSMDRCLDSLVQNVLSCCSLTAKDSRCEYTQDRPPNASELRRRSCLASPVVFRMK